ncbi:MAG: hypothetical protein R2796_02305 [Chitinophagaceae bacterium]|nr:hypothetical protein [Chitinophagaceae bacterium]MCB0740460.1 hypothetical protein [Chitinophagaceae bacterium]HQU55965.1 hypothetical protein [Chitinophagaceae bacterium]HQV05370.1 hypothetical protein [Chitinophagaceae bacterium]
MDTNSSTDQAVAASTTAVSSTSSVLQTKMPSNIAFIVVVLLFFLPFIDIKCNGTSLQTVNGIQLATGFKMKNNSSGNSMMNQLKTKSMDETITKSTTKSDKKDPNLFAMIALGLGVIGIALSFAKGKTAMAAAVATGVAGAAAMIGLFIDIKKNVKTSMPGSDVGDLGDTMTKGLRITVDFTPWFYIAVLAFLTAAYFCYKRMSAPQ